MESRAADVSPDGLYRYTLTRDWSNEPTLGGEPGERAFLLFALLNPSTADARADDPTVRRCRGFARAWGYTGFGIVNPFAYRAADPRELVRLLRAVGDPIGPRNREFVERELARAQLVIAGWGASYPPALAYYVREFRRRLVERGAYCLGYTASGEPRHPLYLPGATRPIPLTMDDPR